MTHQQIKELLEMVSTLGLEELEIEREGFHLRVLGRRTSYAVSAPVPVAPAPLPPAPAAAASSAPAEPAAPAPTLAASRDADDARYAKVTAPMIGTFYRAAAPESPAFVDVGDSVDENTVLCIIEAMKLMNEIKAETRGTIRKVLVENGQPVEYGQPIFLIEPR
ncbi:MAG: acetyl-CoA carboxylase biotin carboxyl carrier protein [Candidatus Sumerlaeia bacterium]|nr:acetyl-CoA carboxylase biotin carboxyl carrier protein [Candidatus Sumerlaeia bacterium]